MMVGEGCDEGRRVIWWGRGVVRVGDVSGPC